MPRLTSIHDFLIAFRCGRIVKTMSAKYSIDRARTALRNGNEGGQCSEYIESIKPESSARPVTRNEDLGFLFATSETKKAQKAATCWAN